MESAPTAGPERPAALPGVYSRAALRNPYAGTLSAAIARNRVALMSGALEDRKSISWVGSKAPSDIWYFTSGKLHAPVPTPSSNAPA